MDTIKTFIYELFSVSAIKGLLSHLFVDSTFDFGLKLFRS